VLDLVFVEIFHVLLVKFALNSPLLELGLVLVAVLLHFLFIPDVVDRLFVAEFAVGRELLGSEVDSGLTLGLVLFDLLKALKDGLKVKDLRFSSLLLPYHSAAPVSKSGLYSHLSTYGRCPICTSTAALGSSGSPSSRGHSLLSSPISQGSAFAGGQRSSPSSAPGPFGPLRNALTRPSSSASRFH
jgi:hypothetical protein